MFHQIISTVWTEGKDTHCRPPDEGRERPGRKQRVKHSHSHNHMEIRAVRKEGGREREREVGGWVGGRRSVCFRFLPELRESVTGY